MTEATTEAYEFSAPLTVCVDFKNPHAYLAKDLIYALEDDLGLRADWLPYLVPALSAPRAARDSDDRGTHHRRHRATYVERDIRRYAQVRGLAVDDVYRPVNSELAAIALPLAERLPGAAVTACPDRGGHARQGQHVVVYPVEK